MVQKVDILGVPVDAVTMAEAVTRIEGFIKEGQPKLVATANAEMLMRATHDKELKNILCSADMVTPDGAGTVWAAHHLGHEMPERVAGYDMAQELMRLAPRRKRPRSSIRASRSSARATASLRKRTSLPSSRRSRRHIPTSCSRRSACRSRRSGSRSTRTCSACLSASASAAHSTSWPAS